MPHIKLLLVLATLSYIVSCKDASKAGRQYKVDSFALKTSFSDSSLDPTVNKVYQDMRRELTTVVIDSVTYYVAEGDMLVTDKELYAVCRRHLQELQKRRDSSEITEKLSKPLLTIAIRPDGTTAVWPTGTELKYAVLEASFKNKSNYPKVVEMMRHATADWSASCNIRFNHLAAMDKLDANANAPSGVDFVVREFDVGGAYYAQAFFPGDTLPLRKINLDPSFYHAVYEMTGLLRHELGHVIGFRHEHIWAKNRLCPVEGKIWKKYGAHLLESYDPYSVMHYLCGSAAGDPKMLLTDFDRKGARMVYP